MANEQMSGYRRLEELGGSDYEIAEGEPYIKGWPIRDNSGTKVGKVHELLFNPASRKVRYIVAALEEKIFGTENRNILVPVGLAELHQSEDEVFLPGITIAQLAAAPEYPHVPMSLENEIAAREAFNNGTVPAETYDAQTFYEHDHYNERNFYGRRFTDRHED